MKKRKQKEDAGESSTRGMKLKRIITGIMRYLSQASVGVNVTETKKLKKKKKKAEGAAKGRLHAM